MLFRSGEFFHDKHRKAIKEAYIQVGEALKAAAEALEAAGGAAKA